MRFFTFGLVVFVLSGCASAQHPTNSPSTGASSVRAVQQPVDDETAAAECRALSACWDGSVCHQCEAPGTQHQNGTPTPEEAVLPEQPLAAAPSPQECLNRGGCWNGVACAACSPSIHDASTTDIEACHASGGAWVWDEARCLRHLPTPTTNDTPPAAYTPRTGPVHVRGYYRRDGTYVRPHTRRRPRR